jgi:hypothetical protein
MTYCTTKLEGFALCSHFIDSKSLSCNPWYLFMVTFPNKELDIASCPSPLRLSNKILSHTQGDLISISSLTFDLAPFRHDIISRLLRPPAFEPRISLASLPIPLHSLADPQTLHVRYAVTSHFLREQIKDINIRTASHSVHFYK